MFFRTCKITAYFYSLTIFRKIIVAKSEFQSLSPQLDLQREVKHAC